MATTKRSSQGGQKSTASRSRSTAAKSTTTKTGSAKSKAQATPKPRTSRSRAKTTRTTSANGASRTQSRSSSRASAQSRNGSARSTNARSRSNGSSAGSRNGTHAGTAAQERVVGKLRQTGTAVRHVADKAGRPTITVAAAVAGIAGGLALRQRPRSTSDGVAARSMAMLHDVDPSELLGGLGKATVELSQRSRSVAREIERVAAQAERLGKIIS
jgi:hypothetical protein